MKIDINDPNVFNQWRAAYDTMTDAEHLEFCNEAEAKWPNQQSFTYSNFEHLFKNNALPNVSVIEIGGWKGELANKCLENFPIWRWANFDFCGAAIGKTVMTDKRYKAHLQNSPTWFRRPRTEQFDVCVSAHMIEHLSDAHLIELLDWISGIPTVMFEAPISDGENNWHNYYGTHILKMGWNRINDEMQARGYDFDRINQHCFIYRKK